MHFPKHSLHVSSGTYFMEFLSNAYDMIHAHYGMINSRQWCKFHLDLFVLYKIVYWRQCGQQTPVVSKCNSTLILSQSGLFDSKPSEPKTTRPPPPPNRKPMWKPEPEEEHQCRAPIKCWVAGLECSIAAGRPGVERVRLPARAPSSPNKDITVAPWQNAWVDRVRFLHVASARQGPPSMAFTDEARHTSENGSFCSSQRSGVHLWTERKEHGGRLQRFPGLTSGRLIWRSRTILPSGRRNPTCLIKYMGVY